MKTKILKLITEATEPAEIVKEKHDPSKPFTMKFRGIGAVSEKRMQMVEYILMNF